MSSTRRVAGVLLKPRDEAGRIQQVEIVGDGRRTAGVVELSGHLLEGQLASRVFARQVDEPAEQGVLADARHEEDVAGDRRFDHGVQDVRAPPLDVADEGRRALM